MRAQKPFARERRHPRVTFVEPIPLAAADWPDLEHAIARDISYGGMALSLSRSVQPGDRFVFSLRGEGGQTRKLVGEVRYVGEDERGEQRVGLCWIDLGPDESQAVRSFVDARATQLL